MTHKPDIILVKNIYYTMKKNRNIRNMKKPWSIKVQILNLPVPVLGYKVPWYQIPVYINEVPVNPYQVVYPYGYHTDSIKMLNA